MKGRSLEGKVALVTDGSGGVGPAIVQRLASDGAIVAFTYTASAAVAQQLVARIEASGGAAIAIEADCAAQHEIEKAIAAAVERFGRIDILVTSAELSDCDAASKASVQHHDELPGANTRAPGVPVRAVISHMPSGGRIIATARTRAASVNRRLARDLDSRGITFNFVQPCTLDNERPAMLESNAVRKRDDVANLVAYLASEEASFITGSALSADGGYAA